MQPTDQQKAETALIDEATRAAQRWSVFWLIDHPRDGDIHRDTKPARPDVAGLLEGARQALAAAAKVLAAARRNEQRAGEISGEAALRAPERLRPYMAKAVLAVLLADVRRAISEVHHWREYVQHYEGEVASGGKVVQLRPGAFAAPWEGEKVPDDEVPF